MDGVAIARGEEDDKFRWAGRFPVEIFVPFHLFTFDNVFSAWPALKVFIKLNSQVEPAGHAQRLDRLDSMKGSVSDVMAEDTFGPLSNVRFAVFALGSSAYPNFCAFGKYVDNLLLELGGERIMKLATGDEMCAQEQAFSKWAQEAFNVRGRRDEGILRSSDLLLRDDDFFAGGVWRLLPRRRRHVSGKLGNIFFRFS